MHRRIWPIVGASFAALLLLLPLFAWLVLREAGQIRERTKDVQRTYHQVDNAITDVRTNIHKVNALLSASYPPRDTAAIRSQIADIHRKTNEDCATLASLLGAGEHDQVLILQKSLDAYWESVEQSLPDRNTGEAVLPSRDQSLPDGVLRIAERIDAFNEVRLWREEQEIEGQQHAVRQFAAGATVLLFVLELAIALLSTAYLARFEQISAGERARAEKAESELRRLSTQLILVQEEERRTISRELHDEVGQLLTGLRMELGTLTSGKTDEAFRVRLESVKQLAEEALLSVRNLSLLLRPSMLDDLGLEPALRWQAKEFSHRTGVPVSVNIQSRLDHLPEPVRICLYRVIQEALTNCAKHAQARRVVLTIDVEGEVVSASIQDDGLGFDPERLQTQGLGLLGMWERVRALRGQVTITSQPGTGTVINFSLPVGLEQPAVNA